jgi:hypothetical protein
MANVGDSALAAGLAKLRKTGGPTHDASTPYVQEDMTEEDIREHQGRMLDLNIEEWLDLIPDHTFETEYVTITQDQAQLFVDAHEEWEKLVLEDKLSKGGVKDASLESIQLSQETQDKLRAMGAGLQACIEAMAK